MALPGSLLEAWLAAGVTLIQLRAKQLTFGPFLDMAAPMVERCREAGALLVVNDRADVAALSGAHGVHVGQDDLSPAEVRAVAPGLSMVGLSTHTDRQFTDGLSQPVQYLAVGPVFPTSTKERSDDAIGLEGVRRAARLGQSRGLPIVAIGGITLATAAEVIAAGASSIAVIADLLVDGERPQARAEAYLRRLAQTMPPG
jgi:thiamine-phosphate pyrophosphorylase